MSHTGADQTTATMNGIVDHTQHHHHHHHGHNHHHQTSTTTNHSQQNPNDVVSVGELDDQHQQLVQHDNDVVGIDAGSAGDVKAEPQHHHAQFQQLVDAAAVGDHHHHHHQPQPTMYAAEYHHHHHHHHPQQQPYDYSAAAAEAQQHVSMLHHTAADEMVDDLNHHHHHHHHHQQHLSGGNDAPNMGDANASMMSALDIATLDQQPPPPPPPQQTAPSAQAVVPVTTTLIPTVNEAFDDEDNPYKKKVALAKQFLLNNFEHDPRSTYPKRRLYLLYQMMVPDEENQLAYNRMAIVVNQYFEQPERKTRKKSLENLPPGTPVTKKRKRSKLFENIRLKPHVAKLYDAQLDERMKNFEKEEKIAPRRKGTGVSNNNEDEQDESADDIQSPHSASGDMGQLAPHNAKRKRYAPQVAVPGTSGAQAVPSGVTEVLKPQVFVRENDTSYLIIVNSFGIDINSLDCSVTSNSFKIAGKWPVLPAGIAEQWPIPITTISDTTFPTLIGGTAEQQQQQLQTFEVILNFPVAIDTANTARNRDLEEQAQQQIIQQQQQQQLYPPAPQSHEHHPHHHQMHSQMHHHPHDPQGLAAAAAAAAAAVAAEQQAPQQIVNNTAPGFLCFVAPKLVTTPKKLNL